MCLKIPMSAFSEKYVSFTYGLSTHAFTRKDNHPCRRRLLIWKEAEEIINEFPFNEKEDIWLEMQIWDEAVIRHYYENYNDRAISSFQVEERLSDKEKESLKKK